MKKIVRIIIWSLLLLASLSLGLYGKYLSSTRNIINDDIDYENYIENGPIEEENQEKFITYDDFLIDKDKINESLYDKNNNYIKLLKESKNLKVIISIEEKDFLTENSYITFINFINVLYDNKYESYFKKNYEYIDYTNYTFEGFNIEVNPSLNENEKKLLNYDGNQIIRITIDEKKIKLEEYSTTN